MRYFHLMCSLPRARIGMHGTIETDNFVQKDSKVSYTNFKTVIEISIIVTSRCSVSASYFISFFMFSLSSKWWRHQTWSILIVDSDFNTLSEISIISYPYRYMYFKKAWYLKTYIDTNSSIDFESYINKKLMVVWC